VREVAEPDLVQRDYDRAENQKWAEGPVVQI
jgi:hypothetical protein